MPDEVGTGIIRLEVEKEAARADVDSFVAETDAKMKSAGTSSGKSFGDGFSGGAGNVDTSLKKVGTDLDDVKKKAESAGGKDKSQGLGLLLTTALTLGPALLPLGAVAAGALGSIVLTAGAAAVGIKGISDEIKAGTDLGKQYSAGLGTLQQDLQQLERTGATDLLGSFRTDVQTINGQLPLLNGLVAKFSTAAGTDASIALNTLTSGLKTTSPLLLDISNRFTNVLTSLNKWTTNGGLQGFTTYAENELPQVAKTVDELGTSVVTIVKDLAPLGGASLTALRLFAEVLNDLPTGPAQEIALIAAGGFGLAKGVDLIKSGVSGFNDLASSIDKVIAKKFALAGADAAEGAAAGAEGVADAGGGAAAGASKAGGGISGLASTLSSVGIGSAGASAALAGVAAVAVIGTLAWKDHASAVSADNKAVSGLTIALEANNDVLDDNGKKALSTSSSYKDAQGTLKTLGLTSNDLTLAASGNVAALTKVNAAIKDNISSGTGATIAGKSSFTATSQQSLAAAKLSVDLKALTDQYNKANGSAQAQADLLNTELVPAYKTTADGVAAVNQQLGLTASVATKDAAAFGLSAAAVTSGAVSIGQYKDALLLATSVTKTGNAATTALFQALQTFSTSAGGATDKASLLGSSLVALQGDNLSYAGAEADAYAANKSLTDAFKEQNTEIAAGTLAFKDSEKAAITFTKAQDGSTTAAINFASAGAGPLINQLSAMQSAAEKAAEATYQHEVATKGSAQAASDAATIFKTQTTDALIQDAKQLGLTTAQAQALSDQYFNLSDKDLKSTVEAVGADQLNDTLQEIADLLARLTSSPYNVGVNLNVKTIEVDGQNVPISLAGRKPLKDGGVIEYYASGGVRENHVAQIAPASTTRVWAEPETGGEAYIPLAPSKRARSADIWRQTGAKLGQNFTEGGFSGSQNRNDGVSMTDVLAAIQALANRPISIQVNKREIARASNNGNLALNRGN